MARVGKGCTGGGRAVLPTRRAFTFHTGLNYVAFRWLSLHAAPRNTEAQFSGNIAQKHRWEHCKTPRWRCWLDGSQPPRWRWNFDGRNNTKNKCMHAVELVDNFNELLDFSVRYWCRCQDQDGQQMYIGITHLGIVTFQGNKRTHQFKWYDMLVLIILTILVLFIGYWYIYKESVVPFLWSHSLDEERMRFSKGHVTPAILSRDFDARQNCSVRLHSRTLRLWRSVIRIAGSHVCLSHDASKSQRATMKSHAATLSRVRVSRQNRRCDIALSNSPGRIKKATWPQNNLAPVLSWSVDNWLTQVHDQHLDIWMTQVHDQWTSGSVPLVGMKKATWPHNNFALVLSWSVDTWMTQDHDQLLDIWLTQVHDQCITGLPRFMISTWTCGWPRFMTSVQLADPGSWSALGQLADPGSWSVDNWLTQVHDQISTWTSGWQTQVFEQHLDIWLTQIHDQHLDIWLTQVHDQHLDSWLTQVHDQHLDSWLTQVHDQWTSGWPRLMISTWTTGSPRFT